MSESKNFENYDGFFTSGKISTSCDQMHQHTLKGILKKTKLFPTHMLKNHQRQSASLRFPLFRSISECGAHDLSPTDLSAFQALGLNSTICEMIFDEEENTPSEKECFSQEDFSVPETNNNNVSNRTGNKIYKL